MDEVEGRAAACRHMHIHEPTSSFPRVSEASETYQPAQPMTPDPGASIACAVPEPSRSRAMKGRAPHRRDETARIAVLHAADDLLVERGFAGVTIEGIAARAGVAKQTIYRWWPSKVDILLDTLVDDAERHLPVPDSGEPLADLQRYLRALARFLSKEPAGRVMLALIGQAQHDPEMARTFRRDFLMPRRAQERALISRVIDAGYLPAGTDSEVALDSLVGPIFFRALTQRPLPRTFVDGLLRSVIPSDLSATAAPSPAG
jgi:AcrR family transcriptional regulator